MFGRISHRYNIANDFLSLGIHRLWKKRALKLLSPIPGQNMLDLCCGTGDLLRNNQGIGVDLALPMLKEAKKNLSNRFLCADAEYLPFKDHTFEKVIIGFGIRNVPNFQKALSEIHRILKTNGKLVILEFSKPKQAFIAKIYFLYLNKILPFLGGKISKDIPAYRYLAQTIGEFPSGNEFLAYLEKAEFSNVTAKPLSFGIATLYTAHR